MPSINSLFSARSVSNTSVKGLEEYQRRLARIESELDPRQRGLRNTMARAAGMTHRHVIGLSQDAGTPGTGYLPVDTGRLKNSIFWEAKGKGNAVYGRVATNLSYAPYVEDSRGFMARTARDIVKPLNDLFGAYVRKVAR